MAKINLRNVSVQFPIFNATGRSITSKFLEVATGGRLDSDPSGRVLVRALQGINLSLVEGEKVGLVGHNGSGKSTLLRVLNGVYVPTSGQLEVEGTTGSLIDLSLGINPEATGRENIFVRGTLLGLSKREIESKFDEIVAFSELGDFIEVPVRTYSSGMNLRLAFSVSTVLRPEILLMDEWLSVGDLSFKAKAENRIVSLVQNTKILVIATHSRELLEKVCTRAVWLEHGSIKMDGSAVDVAREYFKK
jgi:lipopolysaccharide transport system ATP-binding protein